MLGAGYTFKAVKGERTSTSGRAWLISVGFIALVANAGDEPVKPLLFALGCVGLIAALVLFEWARRTVRGQFFSWIFSSDTPAFLCTAGPYAYVRNPFYTSYLLTMASTLVMVPSLFRLLVLGGLVIYFEGRRVTKSASSRAARSLSEYARYGSGRAASFRSSARCDNAMTPRPRLTTSVFDQEALSVRRQIERVIRAVRMLQLEERFVVLSP